MQRRRSHPHPRFLFANHHRFRVPVQGNEQTVATGILRRRP